MNLDTIVSHLDALLRTAELPDYPNALNGLQVRNSGTITRVAAAVDASEETIRIAAREGCNLLVVHHGLFWDGVGRIDGRRYRRLKLLFDHDIAVYSSHLPLDAHPEYGNNALLAQAIELDIRGFFGAFQGMPLGVWGTLEIRREALAARLDEVLGGRVKLIPGGPEMIKTAGVITGSASSMIADAVSLKLDAFITGEGAHHTYFDAMENGINVYYGGHYATETFGVRAVAQVIEDEFQTPWVFIDAPTGL